jgi:hypothetical protein
MRSGRFLRGPRRECVRQRLTRRLSLLGAILLLTALAAGAVGRVLPALALERGDRQRALLATVQVIVPDASGRPFSTGSGTVIDAERGLILTNYHVLGDTNTGRLFNAEGSAVIGVNPANLRSVPVLKYRARMLQGDPEIDLAVLQIVAPFDNPTGTLPANLGLVDIERGYSSNLLIGDPIYVLGFPGLGGDTVTYTEGIVSGFLDEDRNGVEEWMKTDAEINRGNSGGLAVNDAGEFIGVPSAGRTDAESAGKIGLIRPGDVALEYYDKWTSAGSAAALPQPAILNVTFGPEVAGDGRVAQPISRFSTGSTALYVSFDYINLPEGEPLTYRWLLDGREISGGVATTSGPAGAQSLALDSSDALPDGLYELELSLGRRVLYRGSVVVSNSLAAVQLGPMRFARGVAADGSPIDGADAFTNVREVFAIFPAFGLRNGVVMRSTWTHDGAVVLDDEAAWSQGDVTTAWLSISHPAGLPVGEYELTLAIDGRRAQVGRFRVTENSAAPAPVTVNVVGNVSDADNSSRAIVGAAVYLLRPGATLDEWVRTQFDERLIYAQGATTADGSFQLNRRVETGRSYAVLVIHEEYQSAREEAWVVPAGAADPWRLEVELQAR